MAVGDGYSTIHVMTDDEERARYDGIGLRDLFRKDDGTVWHVVSIATDPTVNLRQVGADPVLPPETYVIRSPLFEQRFEQLSTTRKRSERT